MKCLLSVLVSAVVLEICSAHLCMISPPQRGSMVGINKEGANDCLLVTARCGGRPNRGSVLTLIRGQNFTVTLQKNLDHYTQATPGAFYVSIGNEIGGTKLTQLGMVPDAGEPSLSLYSMNVTIPTDLEPREYVFQATYVTNNAAAPAEFYQCSDILVI